MGKVKIKEFAQVITGGTPSTTKPEYWEGGEIPWLNSGELNQKIVTKSRNFITEIGLDKCSARLMPIDTVLIALTGSTTGVVGYLTFEACANQSVTGILPSTKHDPKYLYYFLNSIRSKVLNDAYGGAQPHISQAYVKDLEIPLPSLSTQKTITTKLDKAQEIISYNKQLLEKYDQLTQSLFIDMFGDPVRNEKGWEKVKLGELGRFKNGLNYSKSDNGNVIKILGVGNFKDKWKIEDENDYSFVEIEGIPSEDFFLKNGDLVFVRSNGNKELVGRCVVIFPGNEKITYSGFCIRFRKTSANLDEMFLVQLMRNKLFKKYIFKNGRGANIQNINQELLTNIIIYLPPIEQQNQFADRIEKIQTQKELAQETLAKSEHLFQSLLKESFK